jgi:hypothetical protein
MGFVAPFDKNATHIKKRYVVANVIEKNATHFKNRLVFHIFLRKVKLILETGF